MELAVLLATLFLAFANGANDNLKGVATLYGAGVLDRRRALALASASTAAGALLSWAIAGGLAVAFSGRGILPASALNPSFLAAVALAAAGAVTLATVLGLPVSTTHALVGGLAGAGFVAAGTSVNAPALLMQFLVPLAIGPLLAALLAAGVWGLGRRARLLAGVEEGTCLCVGTEESPAGEVASAPFSEATATLRVMPVSAAPLRLRVGVSPSCQESYTGTVLGLSAATLVDVVHLSSAALVGFARGLNDAPKILGLLLASALISPPQGLLLITIAMTVGGIVAGRRVLETLARKVTTLNAGQGLSANLVASVLVSAGARYGWPLSTTHVVTGGFFGIGLAQRRLRADTVRAILMAWAFTLPLAAFLGAALALALRR